MKINNIDDINSYPENYDNWTEEQRISVVNYMNTMRQYNNEYYIRHQEAELLGNIEDHDYYFDLYRQGMASLSGSKNAYATLGIKVEYGWPGHEYEWFLATRADAENYSAIDEQEPECPMPEPEADDLLDYGDVVN